MIQLVYIAARYSARLYAAGQRCMPRRRNYCSAIGAIDVAERGVPLPPFVSSSSYILSPIPAHVIRSFLVLADCGTLLEAGALLIGDAELYPVALINVRPGQYPDGVRPLEDCVPTAVIPLTPARLWLALLANSRPRGAAV